MTGQRSDDLCPGGIGVDVDTERHTARCPACGSTFTTLMDAPRFSPHLVVGDVIVFPGIPERGALP